VPCPTDCFTVETGVRLRPVPEMGVCLAYTPSRPALHRLNAASWLIVSLCDGRHAAAMEAAYRTALPGAAGSTEALHRGLDDLLALGVIRRVGQESRALEIDWREELNR
jgi:hypothetical protein